MARCRLLQYRNLSRRALSRFPGADLVQGFSPCRRWDGEAERKKGLLYSHPDEPFQQATFAASLLRSYSVPVKSAVTGRDGAVLFGVFALFLPFFLSFRYCFGLMSHRERGASV